MNNSDDAIVTKVNELGEMFSRGYDLMDSTWESLRCEEADLLSDLFRTAGFIGLADGIIEGHSYADEEGESHYRKDSA